MPAIEIKYKYMDLDSVNLFDKLTDAELEIYINGICVTANTDKETNEKRNHLYISLYPLAEWFVDNWYSLFETLPEEINSFKTNNMASFDAAYIFPQIKIHTIDEKVHYEVNKIVDCESFGIVFYNTAKSEDEYINSLHLWANFVDDVLNRVKNGIKKDEEKQNPFYFFEETCKEWELIETNWSDMLNKQVKN